MTQVVTHPVIQVVQVDATKYNRPTYKSPLKKSNFDMWYRSIKAAAFLIIAAPAMIKANDKWFEENNMTEGAICGKVRKYQ